MKRSLIIFGFLLSLISASYLISEIDWRQVGRALREVQIGWLGVTFVVYYSGVVIRAIRWKELFPSHHAPPVIRLFRSILVGQAFNNILPSGRVGEWLRAAHVSQSKEVSFAVAFGTILAERLLDGITLLGFFFLSMQWLPPISESFQISFSGFDVNARLLFGFIDKLAILSGCLIVGILLLVQPNFRNGIMQAWGMLPLPSAWISIARRLMEGFIEGLSSIVQPQRFWRLMTFSLLMWMLNVLAAMTLSRGFSGIEMGLIQAIALVVFQSLATMIPAAPGYWGVYEAGMILGFGLLQLHDDQEIALAYGLVMHLIFFAPTTLVGLWVAAKDSLSPKSANKALNSESTR